MQAMITPDALAIVGEELRVTLEAEEAIEAAEAVKVAAALDIALTLAEVEIIEEAAIDSIPAILIDPKGDLSNLLLTFPDLRPEDFAPWINEDDARRKNIPVDQYAAQQAETWRKGLDAWNQDGERIRRLRSAG